MILSVTTIKGEGSDRNATVKLSKPSTDSAIMIDVVGMENAYGNSLAAIDIHDGKLRLFVWGKRDGEEYPRPQLGHRKAGGGLRMKVYYEVTLMGFIEVDTDEVDEAEDKVEFDTPIADLIAGADLSKGGVGNVEAQVC